MTDKPAINGFFLNQGWFIFFITMEGSYMGLSRSLTTGTSSLRTHQQQFDVISNNIANANTTAYKSNRANFVEQLNQVYNHGKSPVETGDSGIGGINPKQFGLGVKLGSISQDMSQGAIETTNRPLDLAFEGDGFFVYNQNNQDFYSRDGAIQRDRSGNLVHSSSGAFLQGYNIETDANGLILKDSNGINQLDGIQDNLVISPDILSPPKQTENLSVRGNLKSTMPEGESRRMSINVFDNVGGAHTLSLIFTKSANANEFGISAEIDGQAVNPDATSISFNNDGTINSPMNIAVTAGELNTALGSSVFDDAEPKDISIQLGTSNNLISGSMTMFNAANDATIATQDGYQSGELNGLSVDSEGKIWGAFTNGASELLGQVVMAKFTNNEGLIRDGNSFYSPSPNSGMANIGTAGQIFPSSRIIGNALEQSNVDLTVQFTDMISTQRAYEAAARTVTVSDQLLAETNNLKR